MKGHVRELLKSYLQNRKQRVKTNGVFSDFQNVNTGVPQGTILGPLLFILYVNDLLLSMPENSIFSYADDTAVVAFDKNWEAVELKMNQALQAISSWLAVNKLS